MVERRTSGPPAFASPVERHPRSTRSLPRCPHRQDFASGAKSIVLEGKLLRDGQVTADFVAMRYTSNGAFGNYNRGFKSSCGILEDVVEELAEDVGEWLREPTMNALLGDL